VVAVSVIGGIDLMIVSTLIWLASKFESPEKAKQSNFAAKILSFVINVKAKLTFTIEIILLAQVFRNTYTSKTTMILMYAASIICLITETLIKVSMAFLLNIRLRLIEEVPWCAHKSATPLVNTSFKILNGVCLTLAIP